ncbi:MAG: hypothetical protein M3N34_06815 [Pseudomonadota bacterium]|nr:hypothetical protein [Pseudomonadota bacterium]
MIELLIAVPVALFAHHLWVVGVNSKSSNAELISFIWSTLPVLAISNALPMLGATAVLARYAVSEKPAETLKQILEVVAADANRYYETKGYLLSSVNSVKKAMSEAPETLSFFSEGEQLFTPRPKWDGVWFFPWTSSRTPTERAVHEVTYCAIEVVRLVHDVRRHKVALVGGTYGGTNGSLWFLKSLKKQGYPNINKPMTRDKARAIVKLAHQSLHYMREEFSNHRDSTVFNEVRETEFIRIFCEYMVWLGFFHNKVLLTRWKALRERNPKIEARSITATVEKFMQGVNVTKDALEVIAATNFPRRFIAFRVMQLRRGIILPIIGTMLSTLICLSLKPLSGFQPQMAMQATTIAYSLIAASLVSNFTFGLWLLMPPSRHLN